MHIVVGVTSHSDPTKPNRSTATMLRKGKGKRSKSPVAGEGGRDKADKGKGKGKGKDKGKGKGKGKGKDQAQAQDAKGQQPAGGQPPVVRSEDIEAATALLPAVFAHLRSTALGTDALFLREPVDGQPGTAAAARALLAAAGGDSLPSVLASHEPNAWAAVVKVILKEQPEPLVPSETTAQLLNVATHPGQDAKVDFVKRVVSEMPSANWTLLRDLCFLLHDCDTDDAKLGYMFAALLLLPHADGGSQSNAMRLLAHAETLNGTMAMLVTRCSDIFGARPGDAANGGNGDVTLSMSTMQARTHASDSVAVRSHASSRADVDLDGDAPPMYIPKKRAGGTGGMFEDGDVAGAAALGALREGQLGATDEPTAASTPEDGSADAISTPRESDAQGSACLFRVTAMYDYDPADEDELELRIGDEIEVTDLGVDDGWWTGRLVLEDGTVEEGLFPEVYCQRVDPLGEDDGVEHVNIAVPSDDEDEDGVDEFAAAPPRGDAVDHEEDAEVDDYRPSGDSPPAGHAETTPGDEADRTRPEQGDRVSDVDAQDGDLFESSGLPMAVNAMAQLASSPIAAAHGAPTMQADAGKVEEGDGSQIKDVKALDDDDEGGVDEFAPKPAMQVVAQRDQAAAQPFAAAFGGDFDTRPPGTVTATTATAEAAAAAQAPSHRAVVLFDFVPEDDVELALRQGEEISLLETSDPDWWKGRAADGRVGLFPYNYVRKLQGESVPGPSASQGEATPSPAPAPVQAVSVAREGRTHERDPLERTRAAAARSRSRSNSSSPRTASGKRFHASSLLGDDVSPSRSKSPSRSRGHSVTFARSDSTESAIRAAAEASALRRMAAESGATVAAPTPTRRGPAPPPPPGGAPANVAPPPPLPGNKPVPSKAPSGGGVGVGVGVGVAGVARPNTDADSGPAKRPTLVAQSSSSSVGGTRSRRPRPPAPTLPASAVPSVQVPASASALASAQAPAGAITSAGLPPSAPPEANAQVYSNPAWKITGESYAQYCGIFESKKKSVSEHPALVFACPLLAPKFTSMSHMLTDWHRGILCAWSRRGRVPASIWPLAQSSRAYPRTLRHGPRWEV